MTAKPVPYFWLGSDAETPPKTCRVRDVQKMVAAHYRIPRQTMFSDTREGARVRHIAMFLARELTPLSFPNLGRHFGNRDHTTIMYGINAVRARMTNDADLAADVATLRDRLRV